MRADRLRQRRDQLGITQDDLAARIGVNKQSVYRYERGDHEPTADVLTQMAVNLEVTADWLLGLVDDEQARFSESDLTPVERRLIDTMRRGELVSAMQALTELAQQHEKHRIAGIQPTS